MTIIEDELLIGEGVVLDAGAAPVTMRMLSGAIDVLTYGIGFLVSMGFILRASSQLNDAAVRAIGIGWLVIVLVLLPAGVETLTRGKSLGRLAAGLRIVRDDGGPISFRFALARSTAALLEEYLTLGLIAVTTSMFSRRGKRMGDYLAGTYAMRTRGGRSALPPLSMPYGLEGWATTADFRRLPDGLALTSRMFLARATSMHQLSRLRLGQQIANQLNEYVAPGPPPGTHPETFIAGVLVARRDREYGIEMNRTRRRDADSALVRSLPFGIPDVEN
ncbi:RDD family protein [Demequina oxidasica]|uniref:RDD family protein n=1 Tax=Demequina oxidasica TaxID=676199 RepID=UPI000785B8B1|nr:RDD family protein [Demequina oxidasica]